MVGGEANVIVHVLGMLCGLTVLFGIFIWEPWLKHKRNMALICKGKYKEMRKKPLTLPEVAKYVFLGGAVVVGMGAAILVGSFGIAVEVAQWLRLGGLIVLFIGLALLGSYSILRKK